MEWSWNGKFNILQNGIFKSIAPQMKNERWDILGEGIIDLEYITIMNTFM